MNTQTSNASCELSIVMPCLNEVETLPACIKKAKHFLEKHQIRGEIIVADNGSTDGSIPMAEILGARVVLVKVRGYGSALMSGIEAATGQYVIMGDADDSYDFSALADFLTQLRAGADLVMGNRFKGKIMPDAMPLLHRYLGNPVLSGIGRLFFKSPIGDFHCGLRGFRREAILNLELQTTGMEFASEMVVKATLNRLQIVEVPIVLYPDGRSRSPHLRRWRDGWRHLRFLLMYSPRWLFLYPGILLTVLGLIIMGILVLGPVKIGDVTFDIHTLLMAATAIILGVQTITFAVLAKQFAINSRLLPPNPKFAWINSISMELLLIIGCIFVLLGITGVVYGVIIWKDIEFGQLAATQMMRLLIPSATLIAVGFQVITASFFRGILNLRIRNVR